MFSSKTIFVNILSDVKTSPKFNFGVDMVIESPSHQPRVDLKKFG
jgi:hypothetical protein